MTLSSIQTVLVTGGAGYVGAMLVPELLSRGYAVRVLDLYLYGDDVLSAVKGHPKLTEVKGDIRNQETLKQVISGCDAVIHLACISNDPSFELDPVLGRSINLEAFPPLVKIARASGVRRFIFASTSSVYGLSDQPDVDESHPLNPLTDYSRYKAMCEPILLAEQSADFIPFVLRPATVCGYSSRMRLDLTVNILTNLAIHNRRITVFGGDQMRPNIHMADVVDLYARLLEYPAEMIAGRTYNAGYQNQTVRQIADIAKNVVEAEMLELAPIALVVTPTDDHRSYHISSARILCDLGYAPRHDIADAVRDIVNAFREGLIPDAMTDVRYYNVKTMQAIGLK